MGVGGGGGGAGSGEGARKGEGGGRRGGGEEEGIDRGLWSVSRDESDTGIHAVGGAYAVQISRGETESFEITVFARRALNINLATKYV